MKYHSHNLDSKISKLLSSNNFLISEQLIIELQDIFLTNGVHVIDVESLQEGRMLIQKFLRALKCYQSVGCLAQDEITITKEIFDIHHYLLMYGFLERKNTNDLERFFIEDFNFDFIWIERKIDDQSEWSLYFEQRISHYDIDQQIPIIILMYRA